MEPPFTLQDARSLSTWMALLPWWTVARKGKAAVRDMALSYQFSYNTIMAARGALSCVRGPGGMPCTRCHEEAFTVLQRAYLAFRGNPKPHRL